MTGWAYPPEPSREPAADRAEAGVWGGVDLCAAGRAAGKAVAS